jgi:signal transduction histidine kinase/Tfp pilus assembly protein PilF
MYQCLLPLLKKLPPFVFAVLIISCSSRNQNSGSEKIADSLLETQKALADSFYYAGMLDSALANYLIGARYAMQKGDAYYDYLSDNLADAGYCCYEADRYSEAIDYYKDALRYSQMTNNLPALATIYSNMGIAQMLKSDYPGALESFMEALRIDQQIYNIQEISTDYNNLGKLYEAWKNYEAAAHYFRLALDVDVANHDSTKISIRLNSLGMVFRQQKMYDSALFYLQKALFVDEKLTNQKNIATRKSNIGQILTETGKHSEAESYLIQALDYFEKMNIDKSVCISKNCLGDVYLDKGEYIKAKELYLSSLYIAERINYLVLVIENYKDLAYLNQKTGNYADAFRYFEKSKILGDSLFSSDNQKLINEYHIKYETDIKERKMQDQQLALQKSEFRFIFIAIIVAVLLVLVVFLIGLIRFKRKTSRILEIKNTELSQANATKDKLFSIIAHDLKNNVSGIFNLSSALNQNFELITNLEMKDYLEQLELASSNLKSLLLNLLQWATSQRNTITVKLQQINSSEIIREVINQLNGQISAKNLEIRISDPRIIFVSDKQIIKTILYNLTGNAVKFSSPSKTFDINLQRLNNRIRFEISDQGPGISPSDLDKLFRADADILTIGNSPEKGTGLGLILCKDLLKHLDGSIYADSELGKGSRFTFEIPFIDHE